MTQTDLAVKARALLDALKAYRHERNHGVGGPMYHADRLDRLQGDINHAKAELEAALEAQS
jgi:hypothetical protein